MTVKTTTYHLHCNFCGGSMRHFPISKTRRFCSPTCRMAHMGGVRNEDMEENDQPKVVTAAIRQWVNQKQVFNQFDMRELPYHTATVARAIQRLVKQNVLVECCGRERNRAWRLAHG